MYIFTYTLLKENIMSPFFQTLLDHRDSNRCPSGSDTFCMLQICASDLRTVYYKIHLGGDQMKNSRLQSLMKDLNPTCGKQNFLSRLPLISYIIVLTNKVGSNFGEQTVRQS